MGSSSYLTFRGSRGVYKWKIPNPQILELTLSQMHQMCLALCAIGWWMYMELPQTPSAVVVCVIIFNAAFGYRYVVVSRIAPSQLRAHESPLPP